MMERGYGESEAWGKQVLTTHIRDHVIPLIIL